MTTDLLLHHADAVGLALLTVGPAIWDPSVHLGLDTWVLLQTKHPGATRHDPDAAGAVSRLAPRPRSHTPWIKLVGTVRDSFTVPRTGGDAAMLTHLIGRVVWHTYPLWSWTIIDSKTWCS
ncbi:MAG TPA: hypothetical protein VFC19_54265 [Candidatus Limnocylindrales bacterium]|nr:hypothetical protein [Candidatus Limnocylindrales bacterium]